MISYLLSEGGGPLNANVRLWKKYTGLQSWSQATTELIESEPIFDVQVRFPANLHFPRSKQVTTKTCIPDLTAVTSKTVETGDDQNVYTGPDSGYLKNGFEVIRQVKSEWTQR